MTLLLALLLDAVLGEPKQIWSRIPHPAVLMGRLIGWCDTTFNTGHNRRVKGVVVVIGLSALMLSLGAGASAYLGMWIEVVLGAILLAHKSLVEHVKAVADALRMSLGDGRRAVAKIVGRDTKSMTQAQVSRSAIESGAENFSDGVTAPAFWFAVLGLKGILLYKIINTADSMIGYKTEQHQDFGWAAARFDDLLNWVPARLTAVIIWGLSRSTSWPTIWSEAIKHRSPNAGWPEAAMAYALDVSLSGPRSYDGQMTADPFVNAQGAHDLTPAHIDQSVTILWKTWGVLLVLAGLWAVI